MRLYVHGNCQARALGNMFAEALPDWDITSYEVFADEITDQIDRYHDCVRNADLILMQPIHDGYRGREDLASSFVRANARPGATIVTFPSLHFEGQLIGVRSIAYKGLGIDYQDVAFLACYAHGLDLARLIPAYLSASFYSEEQISQELRLSIDEEKRREHADSIDLSVSALLETQGYERQLFHVINHPYRSVLAAVANDFLRTVGVAGAVSDSGPDHLPYPHIPNHPSVRGMFLRRGRAPGFENEDLDATFLTPGRRFSPEEFYTELARDLQLRDRAEIVEVLAKSDAARSFLARTLDVTALDRLASLCSPPQSEAEGRLVSSQPAEPARLRWSAAKLAEVEAKRADAARDPRERLMSEAILEALHGHTDLAAQTLGRLFEQAAPTLPRDDWMFENLLGSAVACELFGLAADILNRRFEECWCSGLGVLDSAPGAMAVRWTVQDSGACRFDLFPALYETDHTLENLFHWSRSMSLYHAYVRDPAALRGHADINVFDVGLTPGISFCDDKNGYFLAPDPIFLSSRGYADLRQEFDGADIPWDARLPRAFWRGATTGHHDGGWRSLPRIRLCELARSEASGGLIDAGISSTVQMPAEWAAEIEMSGLMRPSVARSEYLRCKYQIDIDGNTNAWPGLYERLYTGSPVLKVASPFDFRQWYYDRLVPWWNFVPVRSDMADLVEKIEWLRRNDDIAQRIGERGRTLAHSLDFEGEQTRAATTLSAALRASAGDPLVYAEMATPSSSGARFVHGWMPPADGERRTVGCESLLELRAPAVRGALVLRLGLHALTAGGLTVVANGEVVHSGHVSGRVAIDCRLDETLRSRRDPLSIRLLHPDEGFPLLPPDGEQPVALGLAVAEVSLRLEQAP